MTPSVSIKCAEIREDLENMKRLSPSEAMFDEIVKVDKKVTEIENMSRSDFQDQLNELKNHIVRSDDEHRNAQRKHQEHNIQLQQEMLLLRVENTKLKQDIQKQKRRAEDENQKLEQKVLVLEEEVTVLQNQKLGQKVLKLMEEVATLKENVATLQEDVEEAKLSRVFSERENAALYIGDAFAEVYRRFSVEVNQLPESDRVYRNVPREWTTCHDPIIAQRWQNIKQLHNWNDKMDDVAQAFFDHRTGQDIFIRKLEYYVNLSTLPDLSPNQQPSLSRLVEVLMKLSQI